MDIILVCIAGASFSTMVAAVFTDNYIHAVVCGLVMVGCLFLGAREDAHKQESTIRDKNQVWVSTGCPVYKYSCGKSGYAFEVKTNIIGRIDLGNEIVESYPTCKKIIE